MTIWTSPQQEQILAKNFALEIPKHPEQGIVKQDGVEVGYVNNFTGLTISAKAFGESNIEKILEILEDLGISGVWNPYAKTVWDDNIKK